MSNEAYIEELLWTAYQQGFGVQLAEQVGDALKQDSKLSRVDIYVEIFNKLAKKSV